MEDVLKKIIEFTDRAHGSQTRKYSPDRYIVHPVRVMDQCRQYSDDIAVLAAALMHDVLEDTPTTKEEMREFLLSIMDEATADRAVDLVVELTDVYVKANYPKMNRRTRKAKERDRIATTSADSQTIKYADIIDNCKEIVREDPDFADVFLRECQQLLQRMDTGNTKLKQIAIDTVEQGRALLKEQGNV